MTADDGLGAFDAAGYDQRETVDAERVVAVDAERDRIVACTTSTVYTVTGEDVVSVEGPDGATYEDVAVGRAYAYALADGTVYPLTESGFLGRPYEVAAETIVSPAASSVVVAVTSDEEIAGFDGRTGRERFRVTPTSAVTGVGKARVDVVAGERQFYALVGSSVVGYDSRGREQFRHEFSSPITAAGEVGDTLVAGLSGGRLAWLDVSSGDVALDAPVGTPPAQFTGAGERFLFGVTDDELVVVDPTGKFATLGESHADALVQTYDGSLIGQVTAEGFAIQRLRGSPEASVQNRPGDDGPVVETANPFPVAVSFVLTVSDEDGNEEYLEYSVNAGDDDQTPIAPLIETDTATTVTVRVETEDGHTTLLDERVDVPPGGADGSTGTTADGETATGDDGHGRDGGVDGRRDGTGRRSPSDGEPRSGESTPDPDVGARGGDTTGRSGSAGSRSGATGNRRDGDWEQYTDVRADQREGETESREDEARKASAAPGDETPDASTAKVDAGDRTDGADAGGSREGNASDETSAGSTPRADEGTASATPSVRLELDELGPGDEDAGTGSVSFRLVVRNDADETVRITDVDAERPAKSAVDEPITDTPLDPEESVATTLSHPDRGSVPVTAAVHWSTPDGAGTERVEATVPADRLTLSATVSDTDDRPAVAITAANATSARIVDRVTFTAEELPGYETGVTHELAFPPGRSTVILPATEATDRTPDSVRIAGENVLDTTTVSLGTGEPDTDEEDTDESAGEEDIGEEDTIESTTEEDTATSTAEEDTATSTTEEDTATSTTEEDTATSTTEENTAASTGERRPDSTSESESGPAAGTNDPADESKTVTADESETVTTDESEATDSDDGDAGAATPGDDTGGERAGTGTDRDSDDDSEWHDIDGAGDLTGDATDALRDDAGETFEFDADRIDSPDDTISVDDRWSIRDSADGTESDSRGRSENGHAPDRPADGHPTAEGSADGDADALESIDVTRSVKTLYLQRGDGKPDVRALEPEELPHGTVPRGFVVDTVGLSSVDGVDALSLESADGQTWGPRDVEGGRRVTVMRYRKFFEQDHADVGWFRVTVGDEREMHSGRELRVRDPEVLIRASLAVDEGPSRLTLAFENTTELSCSIRSIEARIQGRTYKWCTGLPNVEQEPVVWQASIQGDGVDPATVSPNRVEVTYELGDDLAVTNTLYRVVDTTDPVPRTWSETSVSKLERSESGDRIEAKIDLRNRWNRPIENLKVVSPVDPQKIRRVSSLDPNASTTHYLSFDTEAATLGDGSSTKRLAVPLFLEWGNRDAHGGREVVTIQVDVDAVDGSWTDRRRHHLLPLDSRRTEDGETVAEFFEDWPDHIASPWRVVDEQ